MQQLPLLIEKKKLERDALSDFFLGGRGGYNEAIEISEASNCRTSYVFVDFIYNHTHEVNKGRLSFSSAYIMVLFFEQRNISQLQT